MFFVSDTIVYSDGILGWMVMISCQDEFRKSNKYCIFFLLKYAYSILILIQESFFIMLCLD